MDQSYEKHPKLMRFYRWAIPAVVIFNLTAIYVVGGMMAHWTPQAVRMSITFLFGGVLFPLMGWWKALRYPGLTWKQTPVLTGVSALVFVAFGSWMCVQAAYGITRPDHIRIVHRSAHPAQPAR